MKHRPHSPLATATDARGRKRSARFAGFARAATAATQAFFCAADATCAHSITVVATEIGAAYLWLKISVISVTNEAFFYYFRQFPQASLLA